MNKEKKTFIGHLAAWLNWPRFIFSLTLLFFLTGILFPFYWMVSSSFKSSGRNWRARAGLYP